jgi:SAM-dependent methyltransferase
MPPSSLVYLVVMSTPRWFTEGGVDRSQWYIDRFKRLAQEGADLAGEARLIDALVVPRSRILDAGCGTGRVGGELSARGHAVVGVDVDPALITAAVSEHPGPRWLVADLVDLDLYFLGERESFDAAVLAGNVMVFVEPGTERAILERVGAHVRPDGIVVVGFVAGRSYRLSDFDADISFAGLNLEHRFATWDLRPWERDSPFAVSILRRVG